jgi:SagB-type dehydrogenase family enzyme
MDPASCAALTDVLAYHEATKHRAGALGQWPRASNWAAQPNPYRHYVGCTVVPLPWTGADGSPPYPVLHDETHVVSPRPLAIASVSELLELSLGVTAHKQTRDSGWSVRANPSAGNLHPVEGYVVLPALDGGHGAGAWSDHPTVCHYAPRKHTLEVRAVLDQADWPPLPPGSLLVGLSSILERVTWKYGSRGYRYSQLDLGHALGALRFAAASLGWHLRVLEEFADDDVAAILGLDRAADRCGAEAEQPGLLAWVGPGVPGQAVNLPGPDQVLRTTRSAAWSGSVQTRRGAVPTTEATRDGVWQVAFKGRTQPTPPRHVVSPVTPGADTPPAVATTLSSREVIRRRRSALAMDGRTSMSGERFVTLLKRALPGLGRPWDVMSGPARVHAALFVHRVEGVTPGLYLLVRDAARVPCLRAALHHDFDWGPVPGTPGELPWFLLRTGDFRAVAARVSNNQVTAGDGAFTVVMIADLAAAHDEHGAFGYRRLHWEAGMLGQVLYLETTDAGMTGSPLESTGLGSFLDDEVHAVLGIEGHALQVLYHLAVGGPVADPRVTTLPGGVVSGQGG